VNTEIRYSWLYPDGFAADGTEAACVRRHMPHDHPDLPDGLLEVDGVFDPIDVGLPRSDEATDDESDVRWHVFCGLTSTDRRTTYCCQSGITETRVATGRASAWDIDVLEPVRWLTLLPLRRAVPVASR
jgi:hypothetical protein